MRSTAFFVAVVMATILSVPTPADQTGGSAPQRGEAPPDVPRFDRVVLLEAAGETSANVAIGDLNGDGHLDIVLAKGRHWPLVNRVLFGDGRGAFSAGADLGPAADRTYSGRLADLDGDGDLDVVISNDTPDRKLVYLNDGKGRFRAGSGFGRAEWATRNISIADLNRDGLPDIVVANRSGRGAGANYVCLNGGAGTFDSECTVFSNESATTITPADFNGDGAIDLAVPHRDGGQSHVYLQQRGAPAPTFRRVPFGPPDAAIRVSEAGDFNGDGVIDIVAIDERRGVTVYFGEPGDRFASGARIDASTATPYALAVADLNLDRRIDVIVGYVEARPAVLFNDGSGRRFTTVHFGDKEGTAYGFAVGDLDRDGRPDIAMARSDAPNVVYLAAAGPGKVP
jgi:hypothetical protein